MPAWPQCLSADLAAQRCGLASPRPDPQSCIDQSTRVFFQSDRVSCSQGQRRDYVQTAVHYTSWVGTTQCSDESFVLGSERSCDIVCRSCWLVLKLCFFLVFCRSCWVHSAILATLGCLTPFYKNLWEL